MSRFLTSILTWTTFLLSAVLAVFGLAFLILAVQRSMLPYNSEGNYFDGVVNYHEQSVTAFGLMAAVSFLAAVTLFGLRLLIQRNVRRYRKDGPDPSPAFPNN